MQLRFVRCGRLTMGLPAVEVRAVLTNGATPPAPFHMELPLALFSLQQVHERREGQHHAQRQQNE